jgi:hypothetical protein
MNPVAVFISGNRIPSPFKILDIKETFLPVGSGNLGTHAHPIDTPSLKSFLKAKSIKDFHGLKATKDKENRFKDHLNHFMIRDEILQLVEGRGTALTKDRKILLSSNISTRKTMMMMMMMMTKTMMTMMTMTRSQLSITSGSSATTSVLPPTFATSLMTATVLTNTVSKSARSY